VADAASDPGTDGAAAAGADAAAAGAPVALSPVPLAGPPALVAGWRVLDAQTSAALVLADLTAYAKVAVRAAPDGPAAAALSCPPGRAVRAPCGELVVRCAPDEWVLLGAAGRGEPIVRRYEAIAGRSGGSLVSVIDVTHLLVLLRLTGDAAAELLATVCAVDLADAAVSNGTAFRSSVARLATLVVRDDVDGTRSYLLASDRSTGRYLFDTLLDAGLELDLAVGGYR
jgi:heterotetrameric sarcosine oxidase gamma subunit